MQQAERGWAGNKGRLGWVGETTASSHQHRCRYRVIVVCCYRRAFGENGKRHAMPFKFRQPVRLAKEGNKEKEMLTSRS